MAKDKKSFVLYSDQRTVIDMLSNEQAGILLKHMYSYVNDENPELNDLSIKLAFEPIKQQLKRDLKKWENIRQKRSQAGKASANKRKQNQQVLTSVESVQQSSTNSTVNVNVNVNDNVINSEDWIYESFELKYFDWVNIKAIEKALQKEFLSLWNEEKERVGQKSYLKTLPERHTELYLQIRSIHTSKEIKHALKALFQQKEIFSETQHLDPTHFLNNFNKWFSAYNEGNKQVYVKKQLNKL